MLQKTTLGYYEVASKPTPDELSLFYSEKYYQEARGSYELAYTQAEIDYFHTRLSRIHYLINLNQSHKSGRSFLDVGCGEGFALAYFDALDFEVSGIDFSSDGICKQNPSFANCIETGDIFSLLELKSGFGSKYDVVLLQNVLEHVTDPLCLLESIKQLLWPTSLVIITVPNDFSKTQETLLAKGCIDREFWVCPPDHLSYFNYESLRKTLVHTGFDVHDIISDFPVDWYLFHPGSNYIKNPSNGKSVHLSRVLIENMLQDNDISVVISFYRALAELGSGRDLTAVASLADLA